MRCNQNSKVACKDLAPSWILAHQVTYKHTKHESLLFCIKKNSRTFNLRKIFKRIIMMNCESKKEQEIREKTSPKAASLHWEEELSFNFFKITESTMLISNSYQPYFSEPITNFNEEIRQKQESKRRKKKTKKSRWSRTTWHSSGCEKWRTHPNIDVGNSNNTRNR